LASRFCRRKIPGALRFIDEAYKHGKAIAATGEGVELVKETKTGDLTRDVDRAEQGVLFEDDVDNLAAGFIAAIASHRFQHRGPDKIMA
jgi:catalase